jgi:hypothetical protein
MRIQVSCFILLIALFLIGCGPSNEVIKLQTDLKNALRAEFQITTLKETALFIEYREAGSQELHMSESPRAQKVHRITLFNLKPLTTYLYTIIMTGDDETIRTGEKTFRTDSLPDHLLATDLVINKGDVFDGYILIRNVQPPGQQILIDRQGHIVWYQEFDTTLFRPFSWTSDQTVLALKSATELHEFDLRGNIKYSQRFSEKGFQHLLHHEIIKDSKGNILSLTRNNQVFDLTSVGGGVADTVKGDGILVLDPKGEKIWEWDIFQHEDPLSHRNLLDTKDDWSHANSLSITKDGHYLVSFRHFNQVWKINSETGEIMWKLGADGDYPLDPDQLFYLQHTVHMNLWDEIMLFDNGSPERRTSRAISFVLHPDKKDIETGRINVFLPPRLFSPKQGSAYLMDEDKVLFCSSIKKSIVITDLEGDILWQLNLSESAYRAVYVEDINWDVPM